MHSKRRVLIIVGPTASGKTTLSLNLAEALGGEILSADSRQCYRLMDIGTAKPTADEQARAVHHGIDIKNPDERFSAGEFSQYGREVIEQIFSHGHVPIVVGGSGLYVQALVEGVFGGSYRDEILRDHLRADARRRGLPAVRRWLASIDAEAEKKILPNDEKRLIRALEVCLLAGQPISALQAEKTIPASFEPVYLGLNWPRAQLYARINRRVEAMFAQGLMDEFNRLISMGYDLSNNAMDSVGYKELFAVKSGALSLEEGAALIQQNTRRFSKRQMTWFRRNDQIHWLNVNDESTERQILDEALQLWHDGASSGSRGLPVSSLLDRPIE